MENSPEHDDDVFEIPEFSSAAEQLLRPVRDIPNEHIRQAKTIFNVAIGIGIVGAAILLAAQAAVLFFGIQIDRALIALSPGVVMEVLSFFLIKVLRESHERLDEVRRDEFLMDLVAQIRDQNKKDEAISELVKALRPLRRSPET